MATTTQVTRYYFGHFEIHFGIAIWAATLALVWPDSARDGMAATRIAGGAMFWFLAEYPVHRYLLHMPPPPWRWARGLHKRLHLGHHRQPRIHSLIFIPMFVTVSMAVVMPLVFIAVFGDPVRGLEFFLGFWTGFLIYEWFHLALHVPLSSKNRLYRWLARTHTLHHFKNEHYWFGVTHPFTDMLVGTNPGPNDVEKTDTARTLGYDPEY